MHNLSEHDLIHIWETGQRQHPIDRALTILAAACPDADWSEIQTLSIGQRDARLLEVWERTFGAELASYAECPQCAERLEFELTTAQLHATAPPATNGRTYDWVGDDFAIEFRLPNSRDLAVIAASDQPEAAHQLLINRCIVGALQDGRQVAVAELPATVLTGIAERMSQADPLAEVLLDLTCPACQARWQAHFEIAAFLWSEIAATARRLLREVHILARAYGWREADILALSTARRQFYLELVS